MVKLIASTFTIIGVDTNLLSTEEAEEILAF